MAKLHLSRHHPLPKVEKADELILTDTCYLPGIRQLLENADSLTVNPIHRADKLPKLLSLLPQLRRVTISTAYNFNRPLRLGGQAKEVVFLEKSSCTLVGHLTALVAPRGGDYTICGQVDLIDAPLAVIKMVKDIPEDPYEG